MVKLDMTPEAATLMWCRLIRARKIARAAMASQNIADLSFAFGWIDQILDDLSRAAPADLAPDPSGNEINKP